MALAFLSSSAAFAQAAGRTDGPEGSEVGTGGYQGGSSGRFSIALDFGGDIWLGPALGRPFSRLGVPLYLGGTASLWMTDWFLVDLYSGYSFASGTVPVLVGPRFRSATWPVSISGGLRVGPVFNFDPVQFSRVHFALSPIVSLDMTFARHFIMGLQGSVDIPIAGQAPDIRIGLNVGYRF